MVSVWSRERTIGISYLSLFYIVTTHVIFNCRYRLHQRSTEYSTIFRAKRLFQQFLVDMWAVCDQAKLDWLRTHQARIRADLYGGVEDALISDDVDPASLGRRFILPSSYTGGPRFMAKIYQNSMAIVR